MVVGNQKDLLGTRINQGEMANVLKKVLVSTKEGWEGWVMRLFELEAEGHSPKHSHPWPHINYILAGQGQLHLDGLDYELAAGSYAYVPAGALHQFLNKGPEEFCFLCIVPEEGEQ